VEFVKKDQQNNQARL